MGVERNWRLGEGLGVGGLGAGDAIRRLGCGGGGREGS